MYITVGAGMVILRKWSAYVLALSFALNTVVFYTVYSGEGGTTYPWYISLVGPALLVALYYYTWPVLRPPVEPMSQESNV
jgi:hypothetical protein